MKITVVGAGYVGLPLAAVLADFGHLVWIVRKDQEKNEALKKGQVHIYEPGLTALVKKGLRNKRFIPTTKYEEAIPQSEVIFNTVGTPSTNNGEADLSQVFESTREMAKNLKSGYTLIISKSTAPPGTTRKLAAIIQKYKPAQSRFEIAFSPEFLREGFAIWDTLHPDRLIFGSESQKANKCFKQIHARLKTEILFTGVESAEVIKYCANAYLALRIVYANQLADLCEKTGADITQVIEGIGLDKRIGSHYWYPGLGYGGSCFPKDLAALAVFGQQVGLKNNLFTKMHELNQQRIGQILKNLEKRFGSFSQKTIAILGLACKQGTDDLRQSPALKVIDYLLTKKAKIQAYDPMAMTNARNLKIKLCPDAYQAAKDTQILMILTDWPEFAKLDYVKIKKIMKDKYLFDSRNLLNKNRMIQLGFIYQGVGR